VPVVLVQRPTALRADRGWHFHILLDVAPAVCCR
jgi:hypothetical protein